MRALETFALAEILLDNRTIRTALACGITPQTFEDKRNAVVFEAMESLHRSNEAIDTVTLMEWLSVRYRLEEAGGVKHLSDLVPCHQIVP